MLIYEVCVTAGGECVKRISIIILDIFFTGTGRWVTVPDFSLPSFSRAFEAPHQRRNALPHPLTVALAV